MITVGLYVYIIYNKITITIIMKLPYLISVISIMMVAYGNPIMTVAFNGCNFMYSNQNN